MEFKKFLMIIAALSVVILVSLLGVSYAWYVASDVTSKIGIKTSGVDKIKTDFAVSEYIKNNVGVPILDSEASSKADKNIFSVVAREDMALNAKYTIYLDEISIDDKLKTDVFKWQLLKSGVSVGSGNFKNLGTNTKLNLYTTNLTLNASSPDSYELRVWLSDDGSNQNDLMGRKFSARIKVDVYLVNN